MENKNTNEALNATATPATDMQLRRLTLFSSGVGFFEHKGNITGNAEFAIPFNKDAVNDALKSIVITDPDASPTVTYHSENTLQRTMKGLSVDLQVNNHVAELLNSLKGAEIEVSIPNPLKGRIMLVEFRGENYDSYAYEILDSTAFLSLLTAEGIRIIALNEIRGFTFTDPKIQADMNRALDLIMQSRSSDIRNLTVKLPGQKSRTVSLSYVIPTPIWKVSYRLDLSKEKPFLQGWAIVDNDSDTDWDNVELALVTGRPVSFIQNLYAPYHLSRPTLPLSIAGIAEANTYDSGTPKHEVEGRARGKSLKVRSASLGSASLDGGGVFAQAEIDSLLCSLDEDDVEEADVFGMSEGMIETASGRVAGDQFEFTIKKPVNLTRQQSAMLPLVEGAVRAEKMLVFSGSKAAQGKPMNPAIGAELVNNTGMKLPAGAITVYDGGTYAGDSLIEFFPEGEKRIISYGEDLTVTGSFVASNSFTIGAVSIKSGVLSVKKTKTCKRIYTFRNASCETKRLIVEHPFSSGRAELISPSEYMEKTHNLYRFELQLKQGELTFEIKEDELQTSETTLSNISNVLLYASNDAFPASVQAKLQEAVRLWQKIDAEKENLTGLQSKLTRLLNEQERTRKNLEAAGSQTQQGQNYLSRLVSQDNEIDEANKDIYTSEQVVKDAQTIYEKYVSDMCF